MCERWPKHQQKNSSCESNNTGDGLGHIVGSEDTRPPDSQHENAPGCGTENKQSLQAQQVAGPVGDCEVQLKWGMKQCIPDERQGGGWLAHQRE